MAEYSKVARGSFTYNQSSGTPQIVYLPFQPQKIEVWDYTYWGDPTGGAAFYTYWDSSLPQGYGLNQIWASTGTSPATNYMTSATQTSNCITTFSSGPGVIYGPAQQVSAMTAANPPVVTVSNHGYATGDIVVFEGLYQSATTGMAQICGIPFSITVSDQNTFSILWDASNTSYYTALTSPANAYVKKIINPYDYSPGISYISAIGLSSTGTIVGCTTIPPNCVVGQTVAFRIPSIWGTTQLNSGLNPNFPGSVVYGQVLSISTHNAVVNIDSSNFTPFNPNIPISAVPGLSFAQMIAVGDQNNGVNSPLTTSSPTINGAFSNHTSFGFVLGKNSLLNTAAVGDKILWEATYYDYVQDL